MTGSMIPQIGATIPQRATVTSPQATTTTISTSYRRRGPVGFVLKVLFMAWLGAACAAMVAPFFVPGELFWPTYFLLVVLMPYWLLGAALLGALCLVTRGKLITRTTGA
jgi:hypothetical protein